MKSLLKKYLHLALFAFLALSVGCQTTYWEKNGATETELNSDLQEATWRATSVVGAAPVVPAAGGVGGAIAAGVSHGLRRNELVRQYMLEKGWRLVPKGDN